MTQRKVITITKPSQRETSHKASRNAPKPKAVHADDAPRTRKTEERTVAVPAPFKVQELVEEFTKVTTKLIARLDTETVSQQHVGTIVRQSVFEALRTRKLHHAQIVEIDRLVLRETRNSKIRERLPDWLARAGLRRVEELDRQTMAWFTILNQDDYGDCVRVVHPAYVDANTGALVQSGQVKRIEHEMHGKKVKCIPFDELMVDTQEIGKTEER